jgi:flap endonuclease-1
MGIRYLNKFLRDQCGQSIKVTNISELSGKKIAVDISIYMYKYATEGNLIENIYLMLSIFRYYNIIPIFIFDGKPPKEKNELIKKRKDDKQKFENEYNNLKTDLECNNYKNNDKQEVIKNMIELKKKFVYINKEQINQVKNLIKVYGATYYDAPGEADVLCASLVIKNKVWGCLSDDMDMFVYGCNNIIRYLSLLKNTIVIYNMKGILDNLGITQKELRQICVLSGTDYNLNDYLIDHPTLEKTLKLFKKFHRQDIFDDFYDWLYHNTNYIKNIDKLQNICNLFDINNSPNDLQICDIVDIKKGFIDYDGAKRILINEGFIFPPS